MKSIEKPKLINEYSDNMPVEYARSLYKFISINKRIGTTFVV